MSTTQSIAFRTAADLLEHLGVHAERVLLRPPPGKAREADLLRQKRRCELIDGVLVNKASTIFASRLAVTLGYFIENYVRGQAKVACLGMSAPMRLMPGQVRMPDVCFILWNRFPHGGFPYEPIFDGAPDFAIEISEPWTTPKEMARKRADYFQAGCTLVWEADPVKRSVEMFTSPEVSTVIGEDGVLTGHPVLPGFRLSVKEWFDRAGPRVDKAV